MYFNKEEEKVVNDFCLATNENGKEHEFIYRFYFNDGNQIVVKYDGCSQEDNGLEINDSQYEWFYEFYFIIVKVEKKAKDNNWRKNQYIVLNYHYFPSKWEILKGFQLEKVKKCDCCLNFTLPKNNIQQICTDCGWREDKYLKMNPNEKSGELNLSLNEAKNNWSRFHKNLRNK